jgi:hypothetical protein
VGVKRRMLGCKGLRGVSPLLPGPKGDEGGTPYLRPYGVRVQAMTMRWSLSVLELGILTF